MSKTVKSILLLEKVSTLKPTVAAISTSAYYARRKGQPGRGNQYLFRLQQVNHGGLAGVVETHDDDFRLLLAQRTSHYFNCKLYEL